MTHGAGAPAEGGEAAAPPPGITSCAISGTTSSAFATAAIRLALVVTSPVPTPPLPLPLPLAPVSSAARASAQTQASMRSNASRSASPRTATTTTGSGGSGRPSIELPRRWEPPPLLPADSLGGANSCSCGCGGDSPDAFSPWPFLIGNGAKIVNVLPVPTVEVTRMAPPILEMSVRVMTSPRPVPSLRLRMLSVTWLRPEKKGHQPAKANDSLSFAAFVRNAWHAHAMHFNQMDSHTPERAEKERELVLGNAHPARRTRRVRQHSVSRSTLSMLEPGSEDKTRRESG